MKSRILRALIRAEEWLVNKFSPYLEDAELQEYIKTVNQHKKEVGR